MSDVLNVTTYLYIFFSQIKFHEASKKYQSAVHVTRGV